MGFGGLICITPRFTREESKLVILEKQGDEEFVRGEVLKRKQIDSNQPESKIAKKKRKPKDRATSTAEARQDSGDRISFSRLVSILRDSYIVTMTSFANKPGGLGGMVMGGNIDLPDATPTRTFKEPRNFVRSWSLRKPRTSTVQDFSKRGQGKLNS